MLTIDDSLKAFQLYKCEYNNYISEDISESDTRSKLIDSLFIKVLGWSEADIRREGHNSSGYYDYKFSIPGIHFIVEAKRNFIKFSLPSNHSTISINSLLTTNREIITQIRSYSIDESIQYCVLTNGEQFILLKAFNTNNTNWKENVCLVFNGIDDIEKRFVSFYENLSKPSLVHNGGFKYDLPIENIHYKTILSTLIDKDKELIRNSLSASIAPFIDLMFGEIFSEEREDNQEFIKYCFVENEETKKNKNEIERLFDDNIPGLSKVVPAINTFNIGAQITQEIEEDEVNIKNNYPPKPIIIIGSKGAGKTTFINHLFRYRLSDTDIENHFIIYLDFRNFFESEKSFEPDKIAEDILEKIYSKYEHLELYSLKVLIRIYIKEIKRNDENTWKWDKANDVSAYNKRLSDFLDKAKKDSLNHLEALSKYLIRERRKRLIIIIDNADQFGDEIQEKVFVFSHSLTRKTLCGTVISLREGYYYKWQNSPPFDAYESNIYHITAPSYAEVLQKRIEFAISKAPTAVKKVRGANQWGINFEFPSDYIKTYLLSLKTSIFNETNTELIDFLNLTTYPNIREGLRVFKLFLTSGHTKMGEYILREQYKEEQEKSRQVIPFHEFIKSIALQNKHYYRSEISIIKNLFTPISGTSDHFLKIYILKELHKFVENNSYSEKYIFSNSLIQKLNDLGYKINIIVQAIKWLINDGLIDTEEQLSDIEWAELPENCNLFITSKGHYYLIKMLNGFSYFDLILQDTPIFDFTSFDDIKSEFPSSNEKGEREIAKRKASALNFLSYLKLMEKRQPAQIRAVYGFVSDGIEVQIKSTL